MTAGNVGISKNLLSHHLLKYQEQESLTDFKYTARHVAKKIFSATQGLELVVFHLSCTKDSPKLAFWYGKEDSVVIPVGSYSTYIKPVYRSSDGTYYCCLY
jgi:hypothetical protein